MMYSSRSICSRLFLVLSMVVLVIWAYCFFAGFNYTYDGARMVGWFLALFLLIVTMSLVLVMYIAALTYSQKAKSLKVLTGILYTVCILASVVYVTRFLEVKFASIASLPFVSIILFLVLEALLFLVYFCSGPVKLGAAPTRYGTDADSYSPSHKSSNSDNLLLGDAPVSYLPSEEKTNVNISGNAEGDSGSTFSSKRSDEAFQKVNACVYAPTEVVRDDYMMIQVYLYLDEETQQVRIKAQTVDDKAQLRQYKPLEIPLKDGDKVAVGLKMRGVEIDDDDKKEIIWHGSFTGCEFSVYVPKDYPRGTLLGAVTISINDFPRGEMLFKTNVVDRKTSNTFTDIKSHENRVFVSYSHKDSKVVRTIVEGLRITNH